MKLAVKTFAFLTFFSLCLCVSAVKTSAQTVECPADKVCISRDAALKAVADASKVDAQAAEIAAKDKVFADLLAELNKMRVEFAEKSGENTALKQNAVQDRAIIDILIKNARPKKIGLINF